MVALLLVNKILGKRSFLQSRFADLRDYVSMTEFYLIYFMDGFEGK